MGTSVRVVGIREPDEEHRSKYKAAMALHEAGFDTDRWPQELRKYFGDLRAARITETTGLEVEIPSKARPPMEVGLEVLLGDVPRGVKSLRFIVST